MKRNLLSLFLIAIICNFSFAQDLESVLKKHSEAVKGDKLKDATIIHLKMEMTMMGQSISQNAYLKRPDNVYIQMNMMGQNIEVVGKGEFYKMKNGDGAFQPIPKEQGEQFSKNFDFEGPLIDPEKKGNELAYIGLKDFEGTEYYAISLKSEKNGGMDGVIYLDKDSYLMKYQKLNVTAQGQTMVAKNVIKEYYTTKEGAKIPGKVSIMVNGMEQMTMNITELELNPTIDESIFDQ